MGLFEYLMNRFVEPNVIADIELLAEDYATTIMKQRAVDVVVGRIARSLSLVEWRTYEGGTYKKDLLYYHLNIQPNQNENAGAFWERVVRRLIYDPGEALIVKTREDEFLLVDKFNKKSFALKENVYTDVMVGDLVFNRAFYESEVIHLKYENLHLKKVLGELDQSYGKLFERLVHVAMRTNQIRGTAKLTGALAKNEKAQKYLQTFVDKIFKAFSTRSEAIVPVQDGMEYTEHSRETNTRSQVDELNKVSKEYLDSVLQAVGIHPSLVYGDMADISQHTESYLMQVIQPLVEKISDEINRKFFTPTEYMAGSRVKASIVKLRFVSVFDVGQSAEKLVESSTLTPNEVREALGYDRVDSEAMNAYYLTKNIERGDLKGGDMSE